MSGVVEDFELNTGQPTQSLNTQSVSSKSGRLWLRLLLLLRSSYASAYCYSCPSCFCCFSSFSFSSASSSAPASSFASDNYCLLLFFCFFFFLLLPQFDLRRLSEACFLASRLFEARSRISNLPGFQSDRIAQPRESLG